MSYLHDSILDESGCRDCADSDSCSELTDACEVPFVRSNCAFTCGLCPQTNQGNIFIF